MIEHTPTTSTETLSTEAAMNQRIIDTRENGERP
jgi:hypothetical protein